MELRSLTPVFCGLVGGSRGRDRTLPRYLQTEQPPPCFAQCLQYRQFLQARQVPSRSGVQLAAWTHASPDTVSAKVATIPASNIRRFIDSSGLGLSLASWMPSRLRSAKPSNAKQKRRRSLKDQVNVGRKPAMLAHSGSFGDTSGQARLA
jgi:hypothetical protein